MSYDIKYMACFWNMFNISYDIKYIAGYLKTHKYMYIFVFSPQMYLNGKRNIFWKNMRRGKTI